MDPFRDRVAVITGGAAGIGLAMGRAFAERGSHVVVADIDEAAIAKAEEELRPLGTRVLGVRTDVRDRKSVGELARRAISELGRVHIVCNNAGIAPMALLRDTEPEDWEIGMAINFWGVVHGVHAFLPHLLEHDDGHIVNTASMAGLIGMPGLGIYCASKFAVVGLTESLYREVRGTGVSASVLCPMVVRTGIGDHSRQMLSGRRSAPPNAAMPSADEDPEIAMQGQQLMSGNVITPEETAQRVVRGIERKDQYILTHREQRVILKRRSQRFDALFDDDRWPL